jgi:hypothetical protein
VGSNLRALYCHLRIADHLAFKSSVQAFGRTHNGFLDPSAFFVTDLKVAKLAVPARGRGWRGASEFASPIPRLKDPPARDLAHRIFGNVDVCRYQRLPLRLPFLLIRPLPLCIAGFE